MPKSHEGIRTVQEVAAWAAKETERLAGELEPAAKRAFAAYWRREAVRGRRWEDLADARGRSAAKYFSWVKKLFMNQLKGGNNE